jgi:hypothetical protein
MKKEKNKIILKNKPNFPIMNIYKITRGQLITLWVFGLIISLACFGFSADNESLASFILALLVVGGLVFYTLGWRKLRKKQDLPKTKTQLVKLIFIKIADIFKRGFHFIGNNLKKSLCVLVLLIIAVWLAGGGYSFLSKTVSNIEWREYPYRITDSQKTIEKYQKKADEGDAYAQFKIGLAYSQGKGIKEDDATASEWWIKASEQGEPHAQFALAGAYYHGKGIEKNDEKFIELLKKSAEQNEGHAMLLLGKEYLSGDIVEKDETKANEQFKKAFEILQKAAKDGDSFAMRRLGLMYSDGYGVYENDEKAIELLGQAAQKGDSQSKYILGYIYQFGLWGVEQNSYKAFDWFNEAAEQGDAEAQLELGVAYYLGKGTTKDEKLAREWLGKAAEQNVSHAKYVLGLMDMNHDEYLERAFGWFQKAAEQGHDRAQYQLGQLYSEGKGTPKNFNKSIEWWTKAAEQNNPDALIQLAGMYQWGYDSLNMDRNKSIELSRRAAENGNSEIKYQAAIYLRYDKPVEAYKWYLISASEGNNNAKEAIWRIESDLTSEEIAKGQALAEEFQQTKKSL